MRDEADPNPLLPGMRRKKARTDLWARYGYLELPLLRREGHQEQILPRVREQTARAIHMDLPGMRDGEYHDKVLPELRV